MRVERTVNRPFASALASTDSPLENDTLTSTFGSVLPRTSSARSAGSGTSAITATCRSPSTTSSTYR
ncbi:Uncharacterised protein [Bordetella pertussis]|nr:Uncharacterised protein [Bordetella pertussis]CFW41191.1 Uncharacterised protein [Bordetella pertussis]